MTRPVLRPGVAHVTRCPIGCAPALASTMEYDTIMRHAELVGRMTGVDGVTTINSNGDLIGFGGKVDVAGAARKRALTTLDDVSGEVNTTIAKAFTGMRHASAAVACARNGPGMLAIVLSQDGLFTVIGHRRRSLVAVRRLAELR